MQLQKRSQMHPNTTKQTETLVLGPMGSIDSIRCEKTRGDFVARTFALIGPVHPVLHWVSCSYEMISNAHKHYETHQNMRLGSNGVDQVHSLRKITMWLRGTNFCIYCTSSVCFATSFMQLRNNPNAPKNYETHQNMSLGSNGMDQVLLLGKITTWLRGTNLCINCNSSVCFPPTFMHLWNNPKCTQILKNTPKH